MKYDHLTMQQQIFGLETRIRQLEEEHYTNTVYAFECEVVGDTQTLAEFEDKNQSIEKRIIAINKKIAEMRKELPSEESEDGTGSV